MRLKAIHAYKVNSKSKIFRLGGGTLEVGRGGGTLSVRGTKTLVRVPLQCSSRARTIRFPLFGRAKIGARDTKNVTRGKGDGVDDPLLSPLIRFALASIFPCSKGTLATQATETLGHEIDDRNIKSSALSPTSVTAHAPLGMQRRPPFRCCT